MLFAACSNDEVVPTTGDDGNVSFTISLEGVMGSRAFTSSSSFGDGTAVNTLWCFVTDATANKIVEMEPIKDIDFITGTTVDMNLVKGHAYDIAFAAVYTDGKSSSPWTKGEKDMTVDYTWDNGCNNNEAFDAFWEKLDQFTVTGSMNKDVVLKRIMAQVNVGVTEADYEAACDVFTPQMSSAMITSAANTINVYTGTVSNTSTVDYKLANTPYSGNLVFNDITVGKSYLSTDADGDGTNEDYVWLSMSYVLAPDTDSENGANQTTLDELDFTFAESETSAATQVGTNDGLTNVPVQRNYRTNIIGTLLTEQAEFKITVDPSWDGDYNNTVEAATADGLLAALKSSNVEKIVLTEDIDISSEDMYLYSDKNIDLNENTLTLHNAFVPDGKSLTMSDGAVEIKGIDGINVYSNANLTLDNVELNSEVEGWDATGQNVTAGIFLVNHCNNSTITLKNSKVTVAGDYGICTNAAVVVNSGCKLILNNCEITATRGTALFWNIPDEVEATGTTFTAGYQAAMVRGGTAKFTNCKFNLSYYGASDELYYEKTWGGGNGVAVACLTCGNRNSSSYKYLTDITLTSCQATISLNSNYNGSITVTDLYAIYAWQMSETYTCTVAMDTESKTNMNVGKGFYFGNGMSDPTNTNN